MFKLIAICALLVFTLGVAWAQNECEQNCESQYVQEMETCTKDWDACQLRCTGASCTKCEQANFKCNSNVEAGLEDCLQQCAE